MSDKGISYRDAGVDIDAGNDVTGGSVDAVLGITIDAGGLVAIDTLDK